MPIDLEEMCRRAQDAASPGWTGFWAGAFAEDVPDLIAEIERLRRVIGDLREPERVYLINIGSWDVPSYDAETKRLVEG